MDPTPPDTVGKASRAFAESLAARRPDEAAQPRARHVFAFLFSSLDGCFEGPNHELDWALNDAEFFAWNRNQYRQVGALVLGRRTYEHFAEFWTSPSARENMPDVATFMTSVPKLVVTRDPASLPPWTGTRHSDGRDLPSDLARLGAEVTGDVAVFGSSDLTSSLLEQGLVDELRVLVHPVLLGRGNRLFTTLPQRIELQAGPTTAFRSGNVLLTYRPPRDP
ncbi:dihydrofolate reductase family protein [Nesterenkonia xinjiangensis]|uniref:Dihydrofolate reductase n=1 Tax=Nesterenkonia xinjiangensis TaxID=225327 RepID=A0A7Z0KB90_9MICC|nr:dihydrofolate reductase family protein [Nesterenkonia xinjiangensis]NYJ79055.1 dihydrofolate reductase [Nesterenkonia xinjiangensis]